ncbi:unnamed protein product [Camellia sinensis]
MCRERTANHQVSTLNREALQYQIYGAKVLETRSEDRVSVIYVLVSQQSKSEAIVEVEVLVELEKEKERFYGLKRREMEEFWAYVENFAVDCRMEVQELRNRVNELKSSFVELQGNNGYLSSAEIAAAEMRKSELLAAKENLDRSLASNYQIKAQLQKQLHCMLLDKTKK